MNPAKKSTSNEAIIAVLLPLESATKPQTQHPKIIPKRNTISMKYIKYYFRFMQRHLLVIMLNTDINQTSPFDLSLYTQFIFLSMTIVNLSKVISYIVLFLSCKCFSILNKPITEHLLQFLFRNVWISLPIKGIADNLPLSLEDRLKSHSAEGRTNDIVVVLMAHVA